MALALLATAAFAARADSKKDLARGTRLWDDVRVLADDSMEGRRAGTPGHRRAAEFVAGRFKAAGLEPAGEDGGYLQTVTLESRTIREADSSLALVNGGIRIPIELGADAFFNLRGNFESDVEAPMIFVGHGLRLPAFGHDDLGGLDLSGKVVVAFFAAPNKVPGAAGAHFGSASERWKSYRAQGAIGVIFIPNPFSMDLPWDRQARARLSPQFALVPPDEDLYPGQRVWVQFNPTKLATLLAGTGQDANVILSALSRGEPLPRFDLAWRLQARVGVNVQRVQSENVVGVLPGRDRKLASEYVALSSHLDHLGVSTQGEGDRVFNGAMDNASGVSVLMDVAKRLRARRARPRRSIVFVAVTAEESGLLGSRAYVSRAGREGVKLVGNINSDMFLPLYPFRALTVFGLEESDLGDDARVVGQALGLSVQTDPEPQRNRFIRSDQYSFIRTGVPSLALKLGFDANSPEAALEKRWFAERYHAPADDLGQPVDLEALGGYARMLERLVMHVANRADAPRWKPASVFGRSTG